MISDGVVRGFRGGTIDLLAQLFAGTEKRDPLGRDRHGGSRFWVPSLPGSSFFYAEGSEAAQFDSFTAAECFSHRIEQGVNRGFGVTAG